MKISTKGRYAMRMLLDLAEHRGGGYISLKDIAQRQNISKKYLEQIIPILSSASILKANRGAQGGYMLSRTPDKYTVGEILRLTEGSIVPVDCAGQECPDCERSDSCAMRGVWKGLADVICQYLDGITLQDILDSESDGGGDYVI